MRTIQEIRNSTGLSQAEFAAALKIPVISIQKWESGEISCPERVVQLIDLMVECDPKFTK